MTTLHSITRASVRHLGFLVFVGRPGISPLGRVGAGLWAVARIGAKYYTRTHKSEIPWEHAPEIPLESATELPLDKSSQIHWESDNPLEHTAEKWHSVGKHHWRSAGKCRWKSTMLSEVLISGVQSFTPSIIPNNNTNFVVQRITFEKKSPHGDLRQETYNIANILS